MYTGRALIAASGAELGPQSPERRAEKNPCLQFPQVLGRGVQQLERHAKRLDIQHIIHKNISIEIVHALVELISGSRVPGNYFLH
jgi:hypothetical protein